MQFKSGVSAADIDIVDLVTVGVIIHLKPLASIVSNKVLCRRLGGWRVSLRIRSNHILALAHLARGRYGAWES